MIMEKYNEIILKLTLKTMKGVVAWEKTGKKDGFQVKIGNNLVTISCCDSLKIASLVGGKDEDIQMGKLSIVNSKGEPIANYERKKGELGFEQMKQLFVTIRRKINRVDEILDEILKELE